jgi:hypothetical protein
MKHRAGRPSNKQVATAALAVATLLAVIVSSGPATTATGHSTSVRLLPPLPSVTGPAHADPTAPPTVGRPVRLTVAAIGVDTSLERLDRTADGTLEAPRMWSRAGWYADGVRPGEQGPSVIAGHVDSTTGPAVFFRLHELRPGNAIVITTAAGDRFRFVVDHVRQYPKTDFPAAAVYGPTALPELRLVTCSGDFDRQARSYVDNLVVYAHLADRRSGVSVR